MSHAQVDLEAPFIADNGLEYGSFADYLLDQPLGTWRNERILAHRKAGRSEEALREWIKGFDGDDPTPSAVLAPSERAVRQVRANFAASPLGCGLYI